jgi:hypothetical protein
VLGTNLLRHAINKASIILQTLDAANKPFKKICCQQFKILKDYVGAREGKRGLKARAGLRLRRLFTALVCSMTMA